MSVARFWSTWLLVTSGAVLLALLVWPSEPLVGVVSAKTRNDWVSYELPRWRVPLSVPVAVAGAGYWGAIAAPPATPVTEKAPEDTRWRLAGVIGPESDRRVLVSPFDSNQPVKWLKVGEVLPSGHRITRITDRNICVRIGQRTVTLAIERAELPP